jgi:sterol desaturase/sphingolipid hydroxylase (fatty acid hydroxylase superfamily)
LWQNSWVRNYIALAIPFFFTFIGVELAVAHAKKREVYRLADAVTDLSCGVTSQVVLVFWAGAQAFLYEWTYAHGLKALPAWAAWVVAFFAVDFFYYWWHRLSHEVNVLWAAHVVHHQSEDYNLAVALRQAVLTSWTALPFYLPLAALGVPTVVWGTVYSFSTLYQFWIHTELVGKVRGPIEWVFNLPQHHRVHHAINPAYLDKNYGATLIVWDRLFGTFAAEEEPCVYGITKPLGSFNPMWAQVHYWIEMAEMSGRARGLDKLRAFWKGPAWRPRGDPPIALKSVSPATFVKYDPRPPRAISIYVVVQYAVLIVATFLVLLFKASIPFAVLALAALAIVGGVTSLGAMIEKKRWGAPLEATRLVVGSLAIWLFVTTG